MITFLPLKLKTVTWDTEKKKINEDTQLSLEFYNGFLLALDTLKDLGLKVKLKVIDTSNDTAYVKSLISNKSIGKPDVIITDPPRAGMHDKLVKKLLEIQAPLIVYVSCNPATQARDLSLLGEKYTVTKIQPVDMFPHTLHIENVVQLKRTDLL